ncbi:hypothetical protein, partial [Nocardia brasiliensis]|uniref:hypothetical protein n=1 Tax=Nocardia brasiliensis TaxID=37326 RepID=UPI002457D3F6
MFADLFDQFGAGWYALTMRMILFGASVRQCEIGPYARRSRFELRSQHRGPRIAHGLFHAEGVPPMARGRIVIVDAFEG